MMAIDIDFFLNFFHNLYILERQFSKHYRKRIPQQLGEFYTIWVDAVRFLNHKLYK